MITFQELTDKIGSAEIYSGTQVDQATQAALLEWNFDRPLSMIDGQETTWLRHYRRNLNMFYPIYLDYLRVETVRSNMDPFITEFMERIHEDTGTSTASGSGSKSGQSSNTGSDRTVTDNRQVRTPDLTTAGTNGNTRTDNLATSSTNSDTGTVANNGSDSSTDNTEQRNMNVAYPEANMNAIPNDIDNFPTNIDYAESEVDQFGKNTHSGTNTNTETRNLSQTGSGTQTGTVTDAGSSNVHETGTDTVDFDGDVQKTTSGSATNSETTTSSNSTLDTRNIEETEQGRHESIADLLPKAISAITSTNSIKWLVNSLQLCFDNYSEM